MSTADGGTASGIPENRAVPGFWTITVPPCAFTAWAPAAPSTPVPVSTTAIRSSAKARAALASSRSTDGFGALPASIRTRTAWSVISTSRSAGTT